MVEKSFRAGLYKQQRIIKIDKTFLLQKGYEICPP